MEAGLENPKPLTLLVDSNKKFFATNGVPIDNPRLYCKIVSKLIYLTISRPDITYIFYHLSQFLRCLRAPHLLVVQRSTRHCIYFSPL